MLYWATNSGESPTLAGFVVLAHVCEVGSRPVICQKSSTIDPEGLCMVGFREDGQHDDLTWERLLGGMF